MLTRSTSDAGYFTSERWEANGRNRSSLYSAVGRGRVVGVVPGVYRDADVPIHPDEVTFAAYLKVRDRLYLDEAEPQVVVVGAAAAAVWGYPDLDDGVVDIAVGTTQRRKLLDGTVRILRDPSWFVRPTRIVEHHGIQVLKPQWLAVDLVRRGIGDRSHIRAMLDEAARSGNLTPGDFVGPIAELVVSASAANSTESVTGSPVDSELITKTPAVIIQLGPYKRESDIGPLGRDSYGTDLSAPPLPGSAEDQELRLAAAGYWHLDPVRAGSTGVLVAARQGRTLAVYRIVDHAHRYLDRYWFSVEPALPGDPLYEEFVGPSGKTLRPTRNPVRYWPPAWGTGRP